MLSDPEPKGRSQAAKMLIAWAVGMGIGLGTCGVASATAKGMGGVLAVIGLGIFLLSLAGMVITLLGLLVIRLWERFRG